MKIGDSPPVSRVAADVKVQQQNLLSQAKHSDTSSFTQGRLIKGTVLSSVTDGQILLSVAGKSFTAQSLVPLKVGQELWFEVLREGTPPLLTLAGKQGAVVDLLRLLSSFDLTQVVSPDGRAVAGQLPEAFNSLNPKLLSEIEHFFKLYSESGVGPEPDSTKILKNSLLLGLFDKLGQGAGENKTSKQQLLDFLTLLSQKSEAGTLSNVEESKGLVRLLKLFEAFGQLNTQPVGQDQQNFLLFPCFFSGTNGWGEWLFSLNKEEGGDTDSGQAYGLSFFLDLSNLGELHLQVHLRDNALQGVFSVLDEGVSGHVSENLEELARALENLGFHPVNLSCQLDQAANLQKLKEEIAKFAGKKSFSLVDVTI